MIFLTVALGALALIALASAWRWRRESRHWEANANMWHKAWDRDVRGNTLSAHEARRP